MKKCPNIKKRHLFPKYACPFFQEQVPKMSFSPMSHRQPLAMGSSRGGAPRKCRGVREGGRGAAPPPRMIYLYYSISRFAGLQNGWSFGISRKGGYTIKVGPLVFPEKEVIKIAEFSVFPDTQFLKIAGFSVFPDSQVLRMTDDPNSHLYHIFHT